LMLSVLAGGVIFVGLIYLLTGVFMRLAVGRQSAANTQARTQQVAHETGIGTVDALVLRPSSQEWRVGLLCIVFFGGGSLLFWPDVLADPLGAGIEAWLVVVCAVVFSLAGAFLIGRAFLRIRLTREVIERRWLWRKTRYALRSHVKTEPLGKSWASGVKLFFHEEKVLHVRSDLIGYPEFAARFERIDPEPAFAMRAAANARKATQKKRRNA
ncbi:MAG: hypothetical protein AAFO58_00925, partial [Pseudomonadota bacterium]